MRLIKKIKDMQRFADIQKRSGKKIGFVPTMGYLHEGHLSLMRKAKKDTDCAVISIYVNPAQFGPKEDFKKYPRDLGRDIELANSVGVDAIFYPDDKQMYPQGYLTYVDVEKITKVLCGKSRPKHFRGVTTIVTKLFNIVKPDIAYFGQKDAQQAIVIGRMTKDLDLDMQIKILPIIREKDGLAMSSRNRYLSRNERSDGVCLFLSLQKAKSLIESDEIKPKKIIDSMRKIINKRKTAKIDYIEIVDLENLAPVKKISGRVLIALAVWIGKTRLIDNCIVKA